MKYKYMVYYKNGDAMNIWRAIGLYNKTDALGTAGRCLKNGYDVKIIPVQYEVIKKNQRSTNYDNE